MATRTIPRIVSARTQPKTRSATGIRTPVSMRTQAEITIKGSKRRISKLKKPNPKAKPKNSLKRSSDSSTNMVLQIVSEHSFAAPGFQLLKSCKELMERVSFISWRRSLIAYYLAQLAMVRLPLLLHFIYWYWAANWTQIFILSPCAVDITPIPAPYASYFSCPALLYSWVGLLSCRDVLLSHEYIVILRLAPNGSYSLFAWIVDEPAQCLVRFGVVEIVVVGAQRLFRVGTGQINAREVIDG